MASGPVSSSQRPGGASTSSSYRTSPGGTSSRSRPGSALPRPPAGSRTGCGRARRSTRSSRTATQRFAAPRRTRSSRSTRTARSAPGATARKSTATRPPRRRAASWGSSRSAGCGRRRRSLSCLALGCGPTSWRLQRSRTGGRHGAIRTIRLTATPVREESGSAGRRERCDRHHRPRRLSPDGGGARGPLPVARPATSRRDVPPRNRGP